MIYSHYGNIFNSAPSYSITHCISADGKGITRIFVSRFPIFFPFEENAIKDAQFKQIYKQWKGFRDRIYRWNKVNELSFANFATKKLSL